MNNYLDFLIVGTKRIGKTTYLQYNKMLEYMEQHKELAHGRLIGPNARAKSKSEWDELARILNCELGPQKEPKQWQTWNDWKCAVKKKWKTISDGQKTGGGPNTNAVLNPREERLLAIVGFVGYSALVGDGETPEAGIPSTSTPSRKRILNDDTIVETQDKQLKLIENISGGIQDVKDSVCDCAAAIREQNKLLSELISILKNK